MYIYHDMAWHGIVYLGVESWPSRRAPARARARARWPHHAAKKAARRRGPLLSLASKRGSGQTLCAAKVPRIPEGAKGWQSEVGLSQSSGVEFFFSEIGVGVGF